MSHIKWVRTKVFGLRILQPLRKKLKNSTAIFPSGCRILKTENFVLFEQSHNSHLDHLCYIVLLTKANLIFKTYNISPNSIEFLRYQIN